MRYTLEPIEEWSSGVPQIHVYTTSVVLNAAAMRKLGITEEEPYVRIGRFREQNRFDRIYIAHTTQDPQHYVSRYGANGGRIGSVKVATTIAESLQGYGTYRINPDIVQLDILDDECYEIYFRKKTEKRNKPNN